MEESAVLRGVLVLGVGSFGLGLYDAVAGPGVRHLTGSGFALFGGLLVASLVLRYERPGLDDPRWSATRWRRAARLVLAHTWRIVLGLLIINAIICVIAENF